LPLLLRCLGLRLLSTFLVCTCLALALTLTITLATCCWLRSDLLTRFQILKVAIYLIRLSILRKQLHSG
jgi:hypothetical protein